MSRADIPFNLSILEMNRQVIAMLNQITSVDTFDGQTENLHDDGLFSTRIFGRYGEDKRDETFGYIDLGAEIFHPLIFITLNRLRAFYKSIIQGKEYAVWNPETKDFDKSDQMDGETGFAFFLKYWDKIEFRPTGSSLRDVRIKMIDKYRNVSLTNKVLVVPAGLRDIEVGSDGRKTYSEINDDYRRLISLGKLVTSYVSELEGTKKSVPDQTRVSMQNAFQNIYAYIANLLHGKHGIVQGKWASRRIFDATRNVISAMDVSTDVMGGPRSVRATDTVMGLFQYIKAFQPVVVGKMRERFLNKVFIGDGRAIVTDPKTLHSKVINVDSKSTDQWLTYEGSVKYFNRYKNPGYRHSPVMLGGGYMFLIYQDDSHFKVFNDIDELPEGLDKSKVRPLTHTELIYLSGYASWNEYTGFLTRYPITNIGGIYPSTVYLKTTVKGLSLKELGDSWEELGDSYTAHEFPNLKEKNFLDTMSPHLTRIGMLGADYDGDMCSFIGAMTDESNDEIRAALRKRTAWLDIGGGYRTSTDIHVINLSLHNLTGRTPVYED